MVNTVIASPEGVPAKAGKQSRNIKKHLFYILTCVALILLFSYNTLFAFEETITIPAENPEGITVDLEKGQYIAEIEGGAIALFYPINPNYCWLIGVAVGTDVKGGQDQPNIGTLYFEPYPPVYNQAEAERQAKEAVKQNTTGTYLRFTLDEDKTVRFWVSDFDYTDNSGMIKLKVSSISE